MGERIQQQVMSSIPATALALDKIDRTHSLASNEEPIAILEPPGCGSPSTLVDDSVRYVYLDFNTHVPFEDFAEISSAIPAPNLKNYESPLTWSAAHKSRFSSPSSPANYAKSFPGRLLAFACRVVVSRLQ
jgi:hypothetical protein